MPVGRFRKNPRELDEVEKRVTAAQYPEGGLLFGMGIGLVIPMTVRWVVEISSIVATLSTGFGPMVCGVVGYLLGHLYKRWRLDSLRGEPEKEVPEAPVSVEKD
jgi:hypothetical protein